MTMRKKCAYCGGRGPFTRDHVWPRAFLERISGENVAHFSVRSQTVHGADYAIRDVCSECNNNYLSKLDSYFCELYDKYFIHVRGVSDTVEFHYEYDTLLRVLLKIAYNSARIGLGDNELLAGTAHYILGKSIRPVGVEVVAELVSPAYIQQFTGKEPSIIELSPFPFRSAITKLLTPNGQKALTRIVSIRSYFFHLVIPRKQYNPSIGRTVAKEIVRNVKGTVYIDPNLNAIILNTSPQNGVTSFIPQMLRHMDQYRKFFSQDNKKRAT